MSEGEIHIKAEPEHGDVVLESSPDVASPAAAPAAGPTPIESPTAVKMDVDQPSTPFQVNPALETRVELDEDFIEDPDDPVVQTVNVFLGGPKLRQHIHVLQFPLKHHSLSYFTEDITHARFKPKSQFLELEVPVDTGSPFYDTLKGEQFGKHATSIRPTPNAGSPPMLSVTPGMVAPGAGGTGLLSSQVYSSQAIPGKSHYTIGVLKDNGDLHLVPVDCNFQMRPSLQYLDEADKQAKMEAAAAAADSDEDLSDSEDKPKEVQVTIKRRESERATAARKKSHAYLQKQVDDEDWVDLKFYNSSSPQTNRLFQLMYAEQSAPVLKEEQTESYLSSVVKLPALTPIRKRVLGILKNAQIVHFLELKAMFPDGNDIEAVLRAALGDIAIQFGDLWIVKSEITHRGRTIQWRNQLLKLFQNTNSIPYGRFIQETLVGRTTANELLSQIAVPDQKRDLWHLKRSPEALALLGDALCI